MAASIDPFNPAQPPLPRVASKFNRNVVAASIAACAAFVGVVAGAVAFNHDPAATSTPAVRDGLKTVALTPDECADIIYGDSRAIAMAANSPDSVVSAFDDNGGRAIYGPRPADGGPRPLLDCSRTVSRTVQP